MSSGFNDDDDTDDNDIVDNGSVLLTLSGSMGRLLQESSLRVNIQILRLRNLNRTPTNGMHAWINKPTFIFTIFFYS